MKVLYFAPLLLASLATAGDVCLANTWITGGPVDEGNFRLYGIKSPCDKAKYKDYNQKGKLCDSLPAGVNICGQNGNLVKTDGGAVDEAGDCGIQLEINGKNYPGRRTHMLGEENPCLDHCQTDSEITMMYGKVIFEGVPMC